MLQKLLGRTRLLATAVLALPAVSLAAPTATAVWRSNLGQSYAIGGNTYALTIPSNETKSSGVLNQDGTVTLTNEWTGLAAPYFDLSANGIENVSVLVKFSGLSIPASGEYGTSLAGVLDSDGIEVGAYVQPGETSLCVFHMTSGSPTQVRVNNSDGAVAADGYMLFSYSASSGVKIYAGETIGTLIGGGNTSYHFSGRTISRLLIGGDNGKYYTPNGFKIEEVALFVGSYLSASDVADYVFPTVTVDPEITTMSALNTKVAALNNEFLYFTSAASVTLDAEPESATQTFLQSDNWKGTVLIKDVEKLNINPTIYGNKNSTLKLSGASGYFAKAQYTSAVTPEIELENSDTEGKAYGFKQTNGYSFNSAGAYAYVNTPKLKGSGTLWGAWNGRAFYVVDDYSEFTGVINLSAGDVVWLGASLPETVSDVEAEVLQKYIRLGGTIPANVASWTADAYDGTVRLTTAISSEDSYKGTFLQNSKWKGTCQLDWNPTGKFDIVNYGNANSTIEIPSTFSALPTQNGGNAAANIAATVKVSGDWTVSDGWTDQTTTFAKLSGAGTLTVNGKTNAGQTSAIPYTITTLEGFTGTLAGARGQFTIGTIVSSVEPTPGTKLVNCTTTKEPVLTSTRVTYGGVEQDVELEFKAGDGIYVANSYAAMIGDQGYDTVLGALMAAYPMASGTVVTVLDGSFSPSSITELAWGYYFRWNSTARTFTRLATTNGEGTAIVAAGEDADQLSVCNQMSVVPVSEDVQNALNGADYGAYFQKTAQYNGNGTWTVTAALSKDQVLGIADETTNLGNVVAAFGTASATLSAAKPGLYYSLAGATAVNGSYNEGSRELANGSSVTVGVPVAAEGQYQFFKLLVNTTDKSAAE